MKKISIYILLGFYLIASIGFSASVHFCSESVAEVAILSELSNNSCGCGSEIESSSCCQEKTYEYKVDTKHLTQANASNTTLPILHFLAINEPLNKVNSIDINFTEIVKFKRGQDPPLRVLHCVYRL